MSKKKNFGKDFLDSDEESLIGRYEEMLAQGRSGYFDVSECEDIIDYYGERYEVKKAMQAVTLAEKLHPLSPSIQLLKASLLAFGNKPRKALNIMEHLKQPELAHELDMFRLKISKAFALISIGKVEEALALQQDLLDNEAIDSADVEQVITVITNGLMGQEKYEEAVRNLQNFEHKIQLSSDLLGYMAYAFAELEDMDKAVEYYKKAVEQNPFDPALWCYMADVLDDADEAMSAYDYALLLDEKMVQAYCGKAELLNEMDRADEAENLLLKGAEFCLYNEDIYEMLVEHYENKQDYDSAMAYCQKMIAEDPNSSDAWLAKARISAHTEKYEEALEACDAAMFLDEELTVSAYEIKASIYMELDLPEKELEMRMAMLKHSGCDVALAHEMGFIYETRDEYEAACRIYAAAITANPKEATLYARMSFALDCADEPELAYRYAQRAVAIDDQNSFAWSLMASLEWRMDRQKDMLRSLKNALTCKECSIGAFVVLYEVAVGGKTPGALSLLEYAENICIDSPVALCYLAALFFSLNDMQKCLNKLNRALSMDADGSLRLFLELCPNAAKTPEIKQLRSAYRRANKKP